MLGVLAMKLTAQTVVGESKVPPNGGRILNWTANGKIFDHNDQF
jgi:hypothetical protein